ITENARTKMGRAYPETSQRQSILGERLIIRVQRYQFFLAPCNLSPQTALSRCCCRTKLWRIGERVMSVDRLVVAEFAGFASFPDCSCQSRGVLFTSTSTLNAG